MKNTSQLLYHGESIYDVKILMTLRCAVIEEAVRGILFGLIYITSNIYYSIPNKKFSTIHI